MLPSRFWTDLTTTDFAALDAASIVAVLPVAAVEQHGPHLPVGTDAFIMEGYLARVLEQLPSDMPVLFLPVQSVGCSIEHSAYGGTLSLSAKAALAVWSELVDSVVRTGCRKLVVVNSHGGNSAPVDVLSQDVRARHAALLVKASWQRFGYPDGVFPTEELTHGIHGGEIETSLMLAFRPDLVRMSEAPDVIPRTIAIERDFMRLRAGRPTGFGWMMQDLAPEGIAGNATRASAEKGHACADHGAKAFIELLADIVAFDITMFDAKSGA